jgi:hypothetical protein
MSSNECEGEVCVHLDFHFGEAVADVETAAVGQTTVIHVQMAGEDG